MNKLLKKLRGFDDTEEMLFDLKLEHIRDRDGGIVVLGDVYLNKRNLEQLPDFTGVTVRGNFYCYGNKLATLFGAPKAVTGVFECHDNQLDNLAGAPQRFKSLKSDFGTFASPKSIPVDLSPIDEERVTKLVKKMKVSKPLKFKQKAA